jgi:hypothetical protein
MVLLVATSAVVVSLLGGCTTPTKKKVDPYEQAASELPAALARAKELGLPMVASDLKRKLPIDPKDNMAVDVRKIQKIVNSDKELSKRLDGFLEMRRSALDAKMILAKLKTLKNLPDLAFEMSKKPECSFVDDWDTIPWISINDYWPANNVGLLLAAKGRAEFELGQWETGQRDLQAATRINHVLEHAPCEYPFYRTMIDDSRITRGYLQAVRTWHHDTEKLLQIKKRFQNLPELSKVRPMLDTAFYYNLVLSRNQIDYPSTPTSQEFWRHDQPQNLRRSGEPDGTVQRALAARNIQSWLQFYDTVDQARSEPDMLDSFVQLQVQSERTVDPTAISRPTPYLVATCIEQRLSSIAARNCIQGLIDVLLFHEKNHRFPNSMDEAGCRLLDPYTGTLLKLKIEGNRCTVSSAGPKNSAIDRWKVKHPKGDFGPPYSFAIYFSCLVR